MPERQNYIEQMPFTEEVANLRSHKDTTETRKIKNQVLWANEQLPFKVEVGQPLELARFAVTENKRKRTEPRDPYEITQGYGRSGIVARMVFKDTTRQGGAQWYRDIDAKGIGHIVLRDGNFGVYPLKPAAETHNSVFGLLNYREAEQDAEWGERLYAAGIRTDRTIAITEAQQIFDPERKRLVTHQELLESGRFDIDESYKPVIQYRAFGVASRINPIFQKFENVASHLQSVYNDARICVANELGEDEQSFTYSDYLKWTCGTLGTQLGRLHSLGWIHGNLRPFRGQVPANVTLDIRLVDKSSMRDLTARENKEDWLKKDEFFKKDLQDASDLILDLQQQLQKICALEHKKTLGKITALDGHQTPFLTTVEAVKKFKTAYARELAKLKRQKG